jgi:hypothetical protein
MRKKLISMRRICLFATRLLKPDEIPRMLVLPLNEAEKKWVEIVPARLCEG